MKISAIINKFHSLGYELFLEGEKIRYKYTGKDKPFADVILPLLDQLRQNKAEVIAFLRQAETMPYVTSYNSLVIPFNCDPKYRYWQGGQSPCDTLKELGRCDLLDRYRDITGGRPRGKIEN